MPDIFEISIISLSALGKGIQLADDIMGGGYSGVKAALEEMTEILTRPMLGVISVQADKYRMTRQNDVPNTRVISKDGEAQSTGFITDSSAPHPRVWSIHGYIDSLLPSLENGLAIKPTLEIQEQYLDNLVTSRKPFLFKTKNMEFVTSLISKLEIITDPKNTTKLEIDVTVNEYSSLKAVTGTAGMGGATSGASSPGSIVGLAPPSATFAITAAIIPASKFVNDVAWLIKNGHTLTQPMLFEGAARYFFPMPFNDMAFDDMGGTADTTSSGTGTVPVTRLILSRRTLAIKPGGKQGIKVTVNPYNASNRAVEWSTTNLQVATVDPKGNVTGIALGETELICRSVSNPDVTAILPIECTATGTAGNGGNKDGDEVNPADSGDKGVDPHNTVSEKTLYIDMPPFIPQEFGDSTLYVLGLTGVPTNNSTEESNTPETDRVVFKSKINNEEATISLVWNRNANDQYNAKLNLLEMMRKQLSLYRHLANEYNDMDHTYDVMYTPPSGGVNPGIPSNVRDFVTFHNRTRAQMKYVNDNVINRILIQINWMPIPMLADNVAALWAGYIDTLISYMEADMWATSMRSKILALYKKLLELRDMLLVQPQEGFLVYVYDHIDILPDFNEVFEYMDLRYAGFTNLFNDVDYWHKLMYWTATVQYRGYERSFILKPNGRLFLSNSVVITVSANQCGEFGNIMHNQLEYTAISIEAI